MRANEETPLWIGNSTINIGDMYEELEARYQYWCKERGERRTTYGLMNFIVSTCAVQFLPRYEEGYQKSLTQTELTPKK